MTHYDRFVGLDIGKDSIAVHVDGIDAPFEVPNTEVGIERLVTIFTRAKCCKAKTLLVLEPTGGYEMAAWADLVAQGYLVRRVDAKQVRHFAKASGRLAKTDPIDARVLRDYACAFPDRGSQLTDEKHRQIKALVARRSALVETRKAIRCRMKQPHEAELITMDHELEALLSLSLIHI